MRGAWSPSSWHLRSTAGAGGGGQGGSRNSSSMELHGPWLHQEGIQELVDTSAARHMAGTSCQTAGRATGAGRSLCLTSTLLRLDRFDSQSPADVSVERGDPTLGFGPLLPVSGQCWRLCPAHSCTLLSLGEVAGLAPLLTNREQLFPHALHSYIMGWSQVQGTRFLGSIICQNLREFGVGNLPPPCSFLGLPCGCSDHTLQHLGFQ